MSKTDTTPDAETTPTKQTIAHDDDEKMVRQIWGIVNRNTNRVEQLEAMMARFQDFVESHPARAQSLQEGSKSGEGEPLVEEWIRRRMDLHRVMTMATLHDYGHIVTVFENLEQVDPHRHLLEEVRARFERLAERFADLGDRIGAWGTLEDGLARIERALGGSEFGNLRRFVGMIRDVLNFNYPEDARQEHLEALREAFAFIAHKGPDITPDDCRALHRKMLALGFSMLPNTRRALAEATGDGGSDGES